MPDTITSSKVLHKSAIKHEPLSALRDILALRSVSDLKSIAKAIGISRYTKLAQPELSERVAEELPANTVRFKETLVALGDGAWDFFNRVAALDVLYDSTVEAADYSAALGMGYLQAFTHNDDVCFVVPTEVKEVFNTLLSAGFSITREHYRLLNHYALAAVNLYGAISTDDFVSLYNSQNNDKTDADEVGLVLSRYILFEKNHDEDFVLMRDFIVSAELDDGGDLQHAEELIAKIGDKPRYIPPRDEFLKYADNDYIEVTPQLERLAEYIRANLIDDDAEVEEVVALLVFLCQNDAPTQMLYSTIEERGARFATKKLAQEFTQLVTDLQNNTRLRSNNGHTPTELAETLGRPLPEPTTAGPVRVTKVGRNEPCPCGSGKKYKKCCGR
ncbi:MAG: SEC-C domain-containing protein [Oscillospiraceae bacterium]|jgi:hypothetical protein|nr:SEC-C domain-containing protein [Oscillospiraceae bacterium]